MNRLSMYSVLDLNLVFAYFVNSVTFINKQTHRYCSFLCKLILLGNTKKESIIG